MWVEIIRMNTLTLLRKSLPLVMASREGYWKVEAEQPRIA